LSLFANKMDEGPPRSNSVALIVDKAKGGLDLDHLVKESESNSETLDFRVASEYLPFEGWGERSGRLTIRLRKPFAIHIMNRAITASLRTII
jgi:hypothetical protein